MPTLQHHRAETAFCDLASRIEDLAARLGGAYDPMLDDLEREFAELRCQPSHA